MNYKWDFASLFENSRVLLIGLKGTLALFVICLLLGIALGLLVAFARRSNSRWLCLSAVGFIEFFRNTPTLVQILWFYYAFPVLFPIEVSPLTAAALGVSLNSAAFFAEIFRAGIQSIERGQWEGAFAIGMTRLQVMKRIILPQAVRRMVPALTNRGIEIFKMTTLASIVAYPEMLHQAKFLASVYFNPIEAYTMVALVFLVCLFPLVQATYALERRLKKADH